MNEIRIPILVWGSGGYYNANKGFISPFYDIQGFVNGDSREWGKTFEGKPVISPSEMNRFNYDYLVKAFENHMYLLDEYRDYIDNDKLIDIKDIPACKQEWILGEQTLSQNRIYCYYFDFPNVGDILNSFLIGKLYNCYVEHKDYFEAQIVGIGSIMDELICSWHSNNSCLRHGEEPIFIWGSGFMYGDLERDCFVRPPIIGALRGKLTKKIVEKIIGEPVNCVLADAGLLVSDLNIKSDKLYKIGIVPHHSETHDLIWSTVAANYKNAIVIDVGMNPMRVIELIASCEVVISTSLHGLIIADSFGIPNLWCEYSNQVSGERFKFNDYYSAFDMTKTPFVVNETNIPEIDYVIKSYEIDYSIVECKKRQLNNVMRKHLQEIGVITVI